MNRPRGQIRQRDNRRFDPPRRNARSPFALFTLLAFSLWPFLPFASGQPAAPPASAPLSLVEYRAHLQSLDQLVANCQRAPGPSNCHSDQVGPDLQIARQVALQPAPQTNLPAVTRQVRLAWLRNLLDEASKPAVPRPDNSSNAEPDDDPSTPDALTPYAAPTLAQQLQDARARLAEQVAQADRTSATSATPPGSTQKSPSAPSSPNPKNDPKADPRTILSAILAAPEYHPAVASPSLWQRALEKIGNWMNKILAKLIETGSKSAWFGYAAEIAFGILVCTAIVWFLIRLERQGLLDPASIAAISGTPSARDWQLWLEDARQAAAQGAWRDAIHLTYWASISRLESSGMWPADRARTPREYLALLSPENHRFPALADLTHSFEQTWYAGAPAQESDFHHAEEIAARLGTSPAKSSAKSNTGAGSNPSRSQEAR